MVDNPDGSVTLTIREVQRFEEATAKLRERGIPAIAVPLREDCVPRRGAGSTSRWPRWSFEFTAEASKITITPDLIPAGRHGGARDGQVDGDDVDRHRRRLRA